MKLIEAKIKIEAVAYINPSESFDKVSLALANMSVGSHPAKQGNNVAVKSENVEALSKIYEYIRSRQTMGVVRSKLLKNLTNNETFLLLNKQAAYAGAIVVCDEEAESPLGAIKLTLRSPDIVKIIDWLAPPLDRER